MPSWSEFDRDVGVTGILAISTTAAMIIMFLRGQPIPPELWSIMGVVWGYYFGRNGHEILAVQREASAHDTNDTGYGSQPESGADRADRASAQADTKPEAADQAGQISGHRYG